jgi:hypothetical protein
MIVISRSFGVILSRKIFDPWLDQKGEQDAKRNAQLRTCPFVRLPAMRIASGLRLRKHEEESGGRGRALVQSALSLWMDRTGDWRTGGEALDRRLDNSS